MKNVLKNREMSILGELFSKLTVKSIENGNGSML